jgi:hypothetical protein
MTVRHEIKSQLAKLLATEDLVVEHKRVETACFNVHTRVLTLPMWEKASNEILNMLVGHEVGHALYTPDIDWFKERKIPPQFVNIVEDVRIEKMMKRRYAGISKTFHRGYSELADQDFFCIADENLDLMNLADKSNLYFKIGNFIEINFSEKEIDLIEKIRNTETFDDVLNVSEELYNFCKECEDCKTKSDELQMQNNQSGQSEDDGEMTHEEMLDEAKRRETENENIDSNQTKPQGSNFDDIDDLDTKTMENLEGSLKDLINYNAIENNYVELPKLNLKDIIVPNKDIHENCDICWNEWVNIREATHDTIFGCIDAKYSNFKKSAQKEVNYLVKEFECKKAADSYARATTARTGVLDCSKLHTYKYNEDLFKKVTTLADGKNHGLIFVLDWSGSMCEVMEDTIKQLYNLIWFCKKVGIPFEVYAFTNDFPIRSNDGNGNVKTRERSYNKRDGLVYIGEWFSMMNLLSSKVNSKTLDDQMKNIYRIASIHRSSGTYPTPVGLGLSGTPLNEAMISLHQIIPQFKKENKVQKVQCVVLTDGEGAPLKYHRQFERKWEDEPFLGTNSINKNSLLRDRKTGNTYSFDCEWHEFTDILLRNLRDNFLDVNFIGVRVLEPRDANGFIRRYYGYYSEKTDNTIKIWKKEKAFSIYDSGYHTYFGLSANMLSQSTKFSPKEYATKSEIKNAFVKSLRTKKMNKKVLSEFVDLIA